MKRKPVVIVGGGLSGLACALTLHKQNISVLMFEAKSVVGGRVSTYCHPSGFLLDEGFQVLLNSYPELPRFLDIESLDLKKFHSGAMVFDGRGMKLLANPVAHPQLALTNVFTNSIPIADQMRVVSLVAKAQTQRDDHGFKGISTEAYLIEHGFSSDFIDFFWRPFLAGVFLDEKLTVDAGFFLFLLRCFGLGSVSVPRFGMAQIPKQMVAQLPQESVRLNSPVTEITKDSVRLATGEVIEADAVINAMGSSRAGQTGYRSVQTHYFATTKTLPWDRWLILVPPRLGMKINHVALLSEVSTDYSPDSRTLISASVVGPKTAEPKVVAQELERLAGHQLNLEWIKTAQVSRALPVILSQTEGVRMEAGVLICGDDVASPSINGALRSGRLAAEKVIEWHHALAQNLDSKLAIV